MKIKVIASTLLLLVVTVLVFFIYGYYLYHQDTNVIESIKNRQYGKNHFLDVDDNIGVHSAADLGFVLDDNNDISIYYGKQIIKVKHHSLTNPEFMKKLEDIGIEIKQHDSQYRVTYWGEVITQWEGVY